MDSYDDIRTVYLNALDALLEAKVALEEVAPSYDYCGDCYPCQSQGGGCVNSEPTQADKVAEPLAEQHVPEAVAYLEAVQHLKKCAAATRESEMAVIYQFGSTDL